jgi:Fe-S-cluster containining protein
MVDDDKLDAGPFSRWLGEVRSAIDGDGETTVACDGCTACCRSAQFIHIGHNETDALAHIPEELLVPAPQITDGSVLLGYDEHGRCPMLTDDGCSIYTHRPRTCRTYDCRVFPAADIAVTDKPSIMTQANRWRFSYPTEADRLDHEQVRKAARALSVDHPTMPPTAVAVLAVRRRPSA